MKISPFTFILSFLSLVFISHDLSASPLLVISVDGLEPSEVFDAPKHNFKITNLRALMKAGSYATVKGVLPTITFPSHTTIVTGVSPFVHGISNNRKLDP